MLAGVAGPASFMDFLVIGIQVLRIRQRERALLGDDRRKQEDESGQHLFHRIRTEGIPPAKIA